MTAGHNNHGDGPDGDATTSSGAETRAPRPGDGGPAGPHRPWHGRRVVGGSWSMLPWSSAGRPRTSGHATSFVGWSATWSSTS